MDASLMSEPTADRSRASEEDELAKRPILTTDEILSIELRRIPLTDLGLELSELSAQQADELGADAVGPMDDRDVVVRAIARQITSPAGTAITDVDAWDDERLQVVLRRLLAEDNWLEHVEPSTVTIASFRAAVRRQTDKFTEQMNRLVLPMRAMARSAYQHAAIADSLDTSDLNESGSMRSGFWIRRCQRCAHRTTYSAISKQDTDSQLSPMHSSKARSATTRRSHPATNCCVAIER